MGEAKRRKKALGATYGNVPPVLVPGSRQFDEHLLKFDEAWAQQLAKWKESAGESTNLDQEQQQIFNEQIKSWMEGYLEPYRPNVQQQLLGGVMDAFYAELDSIRQNNNPDVESQGLFGWLMEILTLYPIFMPYLSSAQKQRYEGPLRDFYDMIIAEKDNMEGEEAEVNQIMIDLFEECFDNEEG
ncbi:hypothetical protein C1752_16055 [Acaryochloris thomasi RCC1774]|uniref:Uncharacterized protein n=1 Tax=Acaryochloris thomasi RCC1774 TaxID=1764569 RepID=A0A2W1JG86_9CYAN|nr:hypothetical protein [Acaryochloris thomasi]PZD70232.1 hypothetical protein C1752_16055 [Acaryochloris thomasi RCC1774]